MNTNIFIEPETMRKAEENTRKALKNAAYIIEAGTPEEIRAAVADLLQKSQAQWAFIRANYHLSAPRPRGERTPGATPGAGIY